LRAFSYSSLSSTLTEISGSPYASGGLAPYSILPTPYSTSPGAYIYVANRTVSGSTTGSINGFALTSTGTTYTLTALTTTASTGIYPVSLAQDATGNYLLAVDSGGSPDLEAYTFDSTTAGKLDSAFTSTTGTDPVGAIAIAAAP
jgi:6-phosphogluconolactonase (cycloisomerase 2 family)